MAVSIADAGDANGRVEGCCWVATVAVVAMDVLFEEIDKAPLHCAAAQSVATLDGFLGWSLSAVLCVMLAVANAEECIAVEGLLLSCAFMARSCLTSSPIWGAILALVIARPAARAPRSVGLGSGMARDLVASPCSC